MGWRNRVLSSLNDAKKELDAAYVEATKPERLQGDPDCDEILLRSLEAIGHLHAVASSMADTLTPRQPREPSTVRQWQQLLADAGSVPSLDDAVMIHPDTRAAIEKFQRGVCLLTCASCLAVVPFDEWSDHGLAPCPRCSATMSQRERAHRERSRK